MPDSTSPAPGLSETRTRGPRQLPLRSLAYPPGRRTNRCMAPGGWRYRVRPPSPRFQSQRDGGAVRVAPARAVSSQSGRIRSDRSIWRSRRYCGPTFATCLTHALQDDPVRMLRAVRLEAETGWRPDAALRSAMRRDAESLTCAAAERCWDEMRRIAISDRLPWSLRRLEQSSLLRRHLPRVGALQNGRAAPHTSPRCLLASD